MEEAYFIALKLLTLLLLHLNIGTTVAKNDAVYYFKPRRLVSCSPVTNLKIQGHAGVDSSIQVSGSFDNSARLNIVGYGQTCSNNSYASAPQVSDILPNIVAGVSATFFGILPTASGRFTLCLSCDGGSTFSIVLGTYTVQPRIVKNHTFTFYSGGVAYVNVSGFGLDIMDRVKIVNNARGCETNDKPSRIAPITVTSIPRVDTSYKYTRFGPFAVGTVNFVNKFHLCYAFDGVSFTKHIGIVYMKPVFSYGADQAFNLTLKSPIDNAFHPTDSKISIVVYDHKVSCVESAKRNTEGLSINITTFSGVLTVSSMCSVENYTTQYACENAGEWANGCNISSGGRQKNEAACTAPGKTWITGSGCENPQFLNESHCNANGFEWIRLMKTLAYPEFSVRVASRYRICYGTDGTNFPEELGILDIFGNVSYQETYRLSVGFPAPLVITGSGLDRSNRLIAISRDTACKAKLQYSSYTGAPNITAVSPSVTLNRYASFPNIVGSGIGAYRLCYKLNDREGYIHDVGILHVVCGEGIITRDGSRLCSSCAPGYYDDLDSAGNSCTPCPKGTYSSISGSSSCIECAAGKYSPEERWGRECLECASGYFSASNASDGCDACAAGQYNPVSNKTQCQACDPGRFSTFSAASACIDCDIGQYVSTSSAANCVLCVSGYYSNERGSSECKSCLKGTFMALSGASMCTMCKPGYFILMQGSLSCKECYAGQYQDEFGSSYCKYCQVGYFRPNDQTPNRRDPSYCVPCLAGTYLNEIGQVICKECASGYYQDEEGKIGCKTCWSRSYSNTGASTCLAQCACRTGYFGKDPTLSIDLSSMCKACPPGSLCERGNVVVTDSSILSSMPSEVIAYSILKDCDSTYNGTSAHFCTSRSPRKAIVPPGYIASPNDYHTSFRNKSSIQKCPKGSYCNVGVAAPCTPGKYAPDIGMPLCYECPSGKYSNATGSSNCTVCPAGYYCPANTVTPCRCGINNQRIDECGRYTEYSVGGPQQFYCPEGSTYRLSALAGYYTVGRAIDIHSSQTNCEVGGECILGNRTLCPGGRFQDEIGKSACKMCVPGMFSVLPQPTINQVNVVCTVCPVGRRSQNPEMTYCDACIPGKYNDIVSQATCKNCNPGLFSNKNATILCTACFRGQWNAEPGRTFCDSCLRGSDTENQTGYTKCVGCPPGRVTNKIGTGRCRLCSANPPQYQDISGQFFCKACMPGRATSDDRTACTESGRNVLLRQTVTHTESYPFVRGRHRLQTYFELNADPSRTIDVDGETVSVPVQIDQVYAYEIQFGTDRSFSDPSRVSYVRGLLLDHELLVQPPPEAPVGSAPILVKNLNVDTPYCSDPLGNEFSQNDDTEMAVDFGNASTHDDLCRLRTTQKDCVSMQEYQLSGETVVPCVWMVPLVMWPCKAQLGSQNAGASGFLCGSIMVDTEQNLFDESVYARVVPVLMPDPFKVGGDIPMPVPLRASGAVYAENPNPFTKFLPWTTSSRCGDSRYLETRMSATKYGIGKNMNVKKLVKDLYGEEFLPDPYKWNCVECPEGASCKGDIFWEGIKPLFGNWRAKRKGMVEFYRCTYEWACLGVMNLDFEARGYMRSSNGETWTTADYMPNGAVSHPDAEWVKRQFALELDENGDIVEDNSEEESGNGNISRAGISNLQAVTDFSTTGGNSSLSDSSNEAEKSSLDLAAFANGPIKITETESGVDILGDFNLALVNHREKCMFGYRGPVCGLCLDEPKFFMSPEGCQSCEAEGITTRDIINTVLLALLVLLVALCIYMLIKNQLDNLEAMDDIISDLKLILKIMMNFMQLLSSIPAIITIEMPPQLFSFLVGINFVQFDVGGIIGLPCIDQGDAFEAYKLDLYIMGGLCGAIIVKSTLTVMRKAGCCPKFCGGRLEKKVVAKDNDENARDKIRKHLLNLKNIKQSEVLTKKQEYMRALLKEHDQTKKKSGLQAIHEGNDEEEEEEDEEPKTITDVLYGARTTIFMIMLFYHTPTMVKTFNFFRCVEVDSIDYLEMDLRIICWTPRHIGMCVFAGFVAVIYGVGLPLGLFLFLVKKRWELHKPRIQKAFGFLMGDYKPNAYFWETLIIVQKMLLTGGLVIFYEHLVIQISIAIIFSGMYQVLSSLYNPFDSYAAGLLNDITAVTETVVYLSALSRRAMESSPSQTEEGQEDVVGIFIVVVLQVAFVFSIIAAGISVYDNANAIEVDVGEDGWDDDHVDERTYKEKLIGKYKEHKHKLSLHYVSGGFIGKMPTDHPDFESPRKIEKPRTGLKKLPAHLQTRIKKKKRRPSHSPEDKTSKRSRKKRSKSPTSNAAQGNSSLMKDYRKKKLEKNPDRNKERKKRKKKKRVKKFSVSAEEI